MHVCSLAVRDETVRSALLTEAAVKTNVKLLSSAAVAAADIDEIVHEIQSQCDDETNSAVAVATEAVLD